MSAPYRSAQKLRRDNCLSEITGNATLLATTLTNLGLADVAGTNVAVASGKTFGVSNSLVLAGTDGTTMTFPTTSATIARTDAANTFTGVQTMTSPVLTTPSLGVATATSINGNVLTTGSSTYTGTAAQTYTFPTTSATIARTDAANTFTGVQTMTSPVLTTPALGVATATKITYAAGTASVAPVVLTSGTNLTSAAAGSVEFDGVNTYLTNETTSGRGVVLPAQYFFLNASGGTISTIANFFGTTSNISLVSGGYYDIEVFLWYTNSADTNTATFTLTNSSAPTAQNIYFEMSPAAGVVAPPGTATALVGQFIGDNTAAKAFNTAALGSGASYYSRFKIWLKNGTGTSLKIQATKNTAGTLTPLTGSYWTCSRLPSANVGAFAA